MTSQIAAIGAAIASTGRALPIAGQGLRGLGKGLEFAGELDKKLQSGLSKQSILNEIAALLQSGTPLASVIDGIASKLSSALIKATGNAGDANAQSTLKRALASALAPPGTSPPGSGTEQAEALAQQLTNIVNRLAGVTNTAGQQSEFPGANLDAETARETPAQQTKPTTAQPDQGAAAALSAFVESLLNGAASGAAKAAADASAGTQPAQTAQTAQSIPPAQQAALPDFLTRMLTRAANAEAQRGGDTLAGAVQPGASSHQSSATGAPVPSSAMLFERLLAIVAEQQMGSQSDGDAKDQQDSSGGAAPQTQTTNTAQTPIAAQSASVPAASAQPTAQPASASSYTTIDPQAVIEQIVKGISLQTTGSTSQIQLRLQPEHLGDVSLKITVTGNTINANLVAQNGAVRDVLLSNQQHLARSLAEAGLSLGKFSVDVSGGNAGFTQQQSQQHARFGRSITAGGSLLSQQDEPWEDQRYGPSLVTSAGSLVFNYLA